MLTKAQKATTGIRFAWVTICHSGTELTIRPAAVSTIRVTEIQKIPRSPVVFAASLPFNL